MSRYATNERPMLSSAGTEKKIMYYDPAVDVKVSLVEAQAKLGKFQQSLSSLNFGATSQITIPNYDFLSEVYITFELPTLQAGQTLPRGWGYTLLQEVRYTIGASNMSEVRIRGVDLMHSILQDAKSHSERDDILKLGGESHSGVNTKPLTACCLLRLPFSIFNTQDKKPFDSSLLSSPILIQINLGPASSIYGGPVNLFPSSLVKASVVLHQFELSNKNNSIRNLLMDNSQMGYVYPYIYPQAISSKSKTGNIYSETQIFRIEEFLDGDLQAIVFTVHRTDLLTNSAGTYPTGLSTPLRLRNIRLSYNGETFYRAEGYLSDLTMMRHGKGTGNFNTTLISQTSGNTSYGIGYMYRIDMGVLDGISFRGIYSNTQSFTSQDMFLEFDVEKIDASDSDTASIRLDLTYFYNASMMVQRGASNITFR